MFRKVAIIMKYALNKVAATKPNAYLELRRMMASKSKKSLPFHFFHSFHPLKA